MKDIELPPLPDESLLLLEPYTIFGYTAEQMQAHARAAIEADRAKSVPDGWVLVKSPITEDMHVAAAKVLARASGLDGTPQRMLDAMLAQHPEPRCPNCDGTGDVHGFDGEWRGTCHCPAGKAAPAPAQQEPEPIDMVLHCPVCGMQHIDAPEQQDPNERDFGMTTKESGAWTNPPHRSHLCHGCEHVWRPADVPTNGVQAVKTKGKADSPLAQPAAKYQEPPQQERNPMTDVEIEGMYWEANGWLCADPEDYKKIVRDTERHHGIRKD